MEETAMMPERASRTFICSVLFLDIVEYSRKPVSEQIRLKDRFNALIGSAIREIPAADRIILDTGDGVAISFLADPEDALFVAMSLRDAFAPEADKSNEVPARIGINLGPVRLVRDLNGRPNIIGDGINVAQRVMGFAATGQILVSRSYFEIVSHISEGYSKLFSYQGSRTDKHVREHEIYSVGYTTSETHLSPPGQRARYPASATDKQTAAGAGTTARLLVHVEKWLANRSLAYGTATFSSLAFLLALLTSFVSDNPQAQEAKPAGSSRSQLARTEIRSQHKAVSDKSVSGESDEIAQQKQEQPGATISKGADTQGQYTETEDVVAEQQAPKSIRKKLRLAFFRAKPDKDPEPAAEPQEALTEDLDSPSQRTEAAKAEDSEAQTQAQIPASNITSAEQPPTPWTAASQKTALTGGRAYVTLAVIPWGEVFVDGNSVGVTPPLKEVELAPGRRLIEIRNGNFPPYAQRVELKEKQKIRIRYKFN
jgi:hypothetical protein